jgi:hypothetical protein
MAAVSDWCVVVELGVITEVVCPRLVVDAMEAGELTRIVTDAMRKRGTPTTGNLYDKLCAATNADADELAALKALLKTIIKEDQE